MSIAANALPSLDKPCPILPNACFRDLVFLVVGAGGTGGYLIRDLAKLIGAMNHKYETHHRMLLVDKDKVEPKNCSRQNFLSVDVGRNKAEVLARRYSAAFNLDIGYMSDYLDDKTKLYDLVDPGSHVILIGCVDNNATRHLLHQLYRRETDIDAYIDSGNELSAGQVICSLKQAYTRMGKPVSLNVKDIVEEFDLSNDNRHPDDLSCAEHAESAPQDITANIMAANIILNYCATIVHNASTISFAKQNYFNSEAMNFTYASLRALVNQIVYFDSYGNLMTCKPFDLSGEDNFMAKKSLQAGAELLRSNMA